MPNGKRRQRYEYFSSRSDIFEKRKKKFVILYMEGKAIFRTDLTNDKATADVVMESHPETLACLYRLTIDDLLLNPQSCVKSINLHTFFLIQYFLSHLIRLRF